MIRIGQKWKANISACSSCKRDLIIKILEKRNTSLTCKSILLVESCCEIGTVSSDWIESNFKLIQKSKLLNGWKRK